MIIDGSNLILGRLASFVAKKLLMGEEVVIVNSENVLVTGKKDSVLERYRDRSEIGYVKKGPFWPKYPEKLVRRTIRGMLPHKQDKGRKAYKRIKCYLGIPEEFKGKELDTIKEANISRTKSKYVSTKEISKFLGNNN